MFRFIHTADAHIDSPLQGLEAYEGAPVAALRGATRLAFENLIDLALDEVVDFLLIAGDLYDGDWKDFSTGLFFTRQMARLKSAGVRVYLISGNHDAASVLTRRLSLPDNVRVFSTRAAESKRDPYLSVVIHGRGFPHRAVPENLVYEFPAPVPGAFNIGLLHTSLTGAPGHDTYAPCTLRDLIQKGYHYWALGHVHQPQVLSRDPWIVFPGNLQGRPIRETGPRGCQLVTVSDALEVVSVESRHLDVVRWECVRVDVSETVDPSEALARVGDGLREALARAEGRLLAARIRLTGASGLHERFKRDLPWVRAECIAQGQIAGGDGVWIEEVEVDTTPLRDPAELAARDDLTRIVLETLAVAGEQGIELPGEVVDMLRVLPAELRRDVEADLAQDKRSVLLEDVRAILLDALAREGSEA